MIEANELHPDVLHRYLLSPDDGWMERMLLKGLRAQRGKAVRWVFWFWLLLSTVAIPLDYLLVYKTPFHGTTMFPKAGPTVQAFIFGLALNFLGCIAFPVCAFVIHKWANRRTVDVPQIHKFIESHKDLRPVDLAYLNAVAALQRASLLDITTKRGILHTLNQMYDRFQLWEEQLQSIAQVVSDTSTESLDRMECELETLENSGPLNAHRTYLQNMIELNRNYSKLRADQGEILAQMQVLPSTIVRCDLTNSVIDTAVMEGNLTSSIQEINNRATATQDAVQEVLRVMKQ